MDSADGTLSDSAIRRTHTSANLDTPAVPFRKSYRSSSAGSLKTGFEVPFFASRSATNLTTPSSDTTNVSTPRARSVSSKSTKSGIRMLNRKPSDEEVYSDTDHEINAVWTMKESTRDKKNRELHRLFPSLLDSDEYIADFQCAMQKDILIQGKIYLSSLHLNFYANIFGFITTLTLPFADILSFEKKTTVKFIPNAISVTTMNTTYTFTSFMAREQCFAVMEELWRQNKEMEDSDLSLNDDHVSDDVGDEVDGGNESEESLAEKDYIDTAVSILNEFNNPIHSSHLLSKSLSQFLPPPQKQKPLNVQQKETKEKIVYKERESHQALVLVLVLCIVVCLLMGIASLIVVWRVKSVVGKMEHLAELVVDNK